MLADVARGTGHAQKRASSDNLSPAVAKDTARRWLSYWLDRLAVVHARALRAYVARFVYYNRASSACKDAGNPSFRGTERRILQRTEFVLRAELRQLAGK